MIKYIVSGTRSLQQSTLVESILAEHLTQHNPEDVLLIHEYVDLASRSYAISLGIKRKIYVACWSKYGLGAEVTRNMIMLRENPHAIVLAFSTSEDTVNCANQARKKRMTVHSYLIEEDENDSS